MDKDELIEAFTDYAKEDIEGAMAVICGLFVGINEAYVSLQGGEPKRQILVEGAGGQRSITIHASGQS